MNESAGRAGWGVRVAAGGVGSDAERFRGEPDVAVDARAVARVVGQPEQGKELGAVGSCAGLLDREGVAQRLGLDILGDLRRAPDPLDHAVDRLRTDRKEDVLRVALVQKPVVERREL